MKFIQISLAALLMFCMSANQSAFAQSKSGKTKDKVVYTGEIAKKVIGYNGPTPLNIHIVNGRIERIEALPNQETPQYLKRATAKVFPQYEGKTVAEARALKADIATGATYTSEALIKNIQLGLEQVKTSTKKASTGKKKSKSRKRR